MNTDGHDIQNWRAQAVYDAELPWGITQRIVAGGMHRDEKYYLEDFNYSLAPEEIARRGFTGAAALYTNNLVAPVHYFQHGNSDEALGWNPRPGLTHLFRANVLSVNRHVEQNLTSGWANLLGSYFKNRVRTSIGFSREHWKQKASNATRASPTTGEQHFVARDGTLLPNNGTAKGDPPLYPFSDEWSSNQTYGAVWHVRPWLSLTGGYFESSQFSDNYGLDLNGKALAPRNGEGVDYSVRFTLFDSKINASVTRFETTQENITAAVSAPARTELQGLLGQTFLNTTDYRDRTASGWEYTPGREIGIGLDYLKWEGADEELTDGMVATETIKLLEANKDRPFFIAAGFYLPHLPYIAPKRFFDLYPLERIQVPKKEFDYVLKLPPGARAVAPWPWLGVNETQLRESVQAYWASISYVDAQVGRLLDALARLGLSENTLIVFWSDHGYHLGEHGLVKKQSLFENSVRVPLIISGPGVRSKGRASSRLVELLDVYPTLAELARLAPPKQLEGKSLKPLLDNPGARWDRPAFTQVWRRNIPGRVWGGVYSGHSVRTERHRYIEWDNGKRGAELYDYTTDPDEKRNLIDDPRHARVVEELRALVRRNWAREYRPPES